MFFYTQNRKKSNWRPKTKNKIKSKTSGTVAGLLLIQEIVFVFQWNI